MYTLDRERVDYIRGKTCKAALSCFDTIMSGSDIAVHLLFISLDSL